MVPPLDREAQESLLARRGFPVLAIYQLLINPIATADCYGLIAANIFGFPVDALRRFQVEGLGEAWI
jgi:hypothetical protein